MANLGVWGGDPAALQAAVEAAFGGDTTFTAAQRLLGMLDFSAEQRSILSRCSASGQYRLWYRPEPVGHYEFRVLDSRGHGNEGWVAPCPHTEEVRAEMARIRKLYEWEASDTARFRRRLENRIRKLGPAAQPIIIEFLERLRYAVE